MIAGGIKYKTLENNEANPVGFCIRKVFNPGIKVTIMEPTSATKEVWNAEYPN
jgi:hypothetical protein